MNNRDIEKLKYDSRMVEINKKARIVSQEELDKHNASLPDLSANAVKIELDSSNGDTTEQ